jgi:anhydro-N-acetylmuramic acid kinase
MPEVYRVTGLMSGSSLDGVDLACCEFSRESGKWSFQILEAETIPYPPTLKEQLGMATSWDRARILDLDVSLGKFYAKLINEFHTSHGLSPDLVASHGHTILHEPAKGITFQAGHGGTMAEQTGIMVVSDFRSEDVAQGGQGAPLVPVGDQLLFGGYDACLNLGGFANISFENEQNQRIAYDVGPANMVLNWIAGLKGHTYDKDGRLASQGIVHLELLEQINALDFFQLDPPKSMGKEWFTETLLPVIRNTDLDVPDLMATAVEHIAMQLSTAVEDSKACSVLVTGGGALNKTLIERFRIHTGAQIHIPELLLVRFKEALIFALLGLLRKLGEVNCLASVTGGGSDLSTGTIHYH